MSQPTRHLDGHTSIFTIKELGHMVLHVVVRTHIISFTIEQLPLQVIDSEKACHRSNSYINEQWVWIMFLLAIRIFPSRLYPTCCNFSWINSLEFPSKMTYCSRWANPQKRCRVTMTVVDVARHKLNQDLEIIPLQNRWHPNSRSNLSELNVRNVTYFCVYRFLIIEILLTKF